MKTLIIYGSNHGCAKKCAELLEENLKGEVDIVDIRKDITLDLNNYDKVVIGGSIYMGKIQKEIEEVCESYCDNLKEKKLGLFICCMNEENVEKQIKDNFPEKLILSAKVQGYFGGAFNFKDMNFFERFIIRKVFKSLANTNDKFKGIDMKKFVDMIERENIENFAKAMNEI
ncbi:flavodoxin domain-containing protein [Clostridium sp. NSJ-49]|uniref:Flavodoxin n=1 Tax=Clostridium disporicum TaxID=84024 RepID=A0A174DHU3_9CLOT|nr:MULTISPECIES: flavodoxin domain-containing protein [Clostridium]MBC5624854.1 flavodoxin domain-containing protein [Clostridium sp. NSJ-49]MCD2500581.1 flavodoxin domain-containing protein [Clostridium sp. NSJ-145]MDU6340054.1 flavodoxin domain-containing protein [Clostridium sp.]CUO23470.1 flavodoxin [Clostridium disporicum]